MLEYFYLLNYKSDTDPGLCMVGTDRAIHPAATDLAIDEVEDLDIRNKIMRLQQWLPHHGVRACLEALTQKDLNFNYALHTLIWQDVYDKENKANFNQVKKGTETSSM